MRVSRRPGKVLISHTCANLCKCANGQKSLQCLAGLVEVQGILLEGKLTKYMAGMDQLLVTAISVYLSVVPPFCLSVFFSLGHIAFFSQTIHSQNLIGIMRIHRSCE